jgi:hypothetical protein
MAGSVEYIRRQKLMSPMGYFSNKFTVFLQFILKSFRHNFGHFAVIVFTVLSVSPSHDLEDACIARSDMIGIREEMQMMPACHVHFRMIEIRVHTHGHLIYIVIFYFVDALV